MELIESSSHAHPHREEKVEPGNLLEECWFFGNLLIDSNTKISRSYSDFCPSSNYNTQKQMLPIKSKKSTSSNKKSPKGKNFFHSKLVRTLSMPSSVKMAVDMTDQVKERHDSEGRKSIARHNLVRAPSLPPCIREEEEDEEDQESEFSLGRLIRQASLNSSDILLPRQTSKSLSIPRKHHPRKKLDQLERNKMEGSKEMRHQHLINQTKIIRSSSDIHSKEVQDFKTLSLKFEKEGSKQGSVAHTFRSLQVKGMEDFDEKKARTSSYVAEAWKVKNSAPRIPKWGADNDKKSAQDMKAQIKFWARAVASDVRSPRVLINSQNY